MRSRLGGGKEPAADHPPTETAALLNVALKRLGSQASPLTETE